MRSVELFAGAGGLAIGMANAWIQSRRRDRVGSRRLRDVPRESAASHALGGGMASHRGRCAQVRLHRYRRRRSWSSPAARRASHSRSEESTAATWTSGTCFPRLCAPCASCVRKAFIFENVKGLIRETFADYFEYIHLQLTHPSFTRRKAETWRGSSRRGWRGITLSRQTRSEYNVVFRLLNAANYGVPQRRERVFLVGFRSDLGVQWSFPGGDTFRGRVAALAVDHRRVLGSAQGLEAPASQPVGSSRRPALRSFAT